MSIKNSSDTNCATSSVPHVFLVHPVKFSLGKFKRFIGSAGLSFVVEGDIYFASRLGDRIPDDMKEREDNRKMNWRKRGNQKTLQIIGS
jgi:hypothetical protein